MPTLDEQIAALMATPGNPIQYEMVGGTPDYAAYVRNNPDLQAEFQRLSPTDLKYWAGGTSISDYGKFHSEKYGDHGAAPVTGGVSTPKTVYDPVTGEKDIGNIDELALARAVNAARSQAKLNVTGRGLDYGQYGADIDNYLSDLLANAPKGLTDYSSYFAPNIADNILGGKETAQRRSLENTVAGLFSGAPGYDIFGSAADEILNPQYEAGLQYLERGMKRGQFNQVGYDSGKSALENARTTAMAKLRGGQDNILGEIGTKYNTLKTSALDNVAGYKLGDNTDTGQYSSLLDSFMKNASTNASGQLKALFAGQNLIDLGELGTSVGRGQGSVNLRDLDVLDALEKRKKTNAVGHGLGSQGVF